MNQNNLLDIAAFTPIALEAPNPWIGHLPFAAWVIREVAPKIFVELGTHSGNSYFSFCQSVAEAGLSSKCYAVDTWQGDEHAGQYGDEVFARVNAHQQERYAGFSRLLRMTFDDAAGYFADSSIELLHIDGLHTYEAVLHDFETWLPKLAPGAVVMFHDTNVRERHFGVWKLWEELQARYPNNLEFVHSHGLGVLQLNNAPSEKILHCLQPGSPEKQSVVNFFAALGSRQLDRFELGELKQYAANLNHTVTNLHPALADLKQAVAERDAGIVERDARIAELGAGIAERDARIATQEAGIAGRDARIAELEAGLAERDARTAAQDAGIAGRDAKLAELGAGIAERDTRIAELGAGLAERDARIKEFCGSHSWRLTRPLRVLARLVK